jgi:TRAP-type mannitol/chloroaromatic compound transport system permease large subunit
MELALLIGVLFLLLIMGLPVAFALGIASLMTFYVLDIPLIVGFQRMAASMNLFALMAIPFFVFAGDLMHRAGIAERLIRVADAALGQRRGGLGQVGVGASMMFGAVSGSAIASVSAIGSTLGPMMREKGYDADYVVNVTATSAVNGTSYSTVSQYDHLRGSCGREHFAGRPFSCRHIARSPHRPFANAVGVSGSPKKKLPQGTVPWVACVRYQFRRCYSGPALSGYCRNRCTVGVFTPTESAGIAVAYTILVALLVYRSLTWEGFFAATTASVRTTAMVMIIIGAAGAFGWLLALLQAPTQLAELLRGHYREPDTSVASN